MNTIYLIGFMGSGKSTIGYALAKRLSKTYIDTDELIEDTYQEKIADIFKVDGEDVFRNYEINALKKASYYDVVSTGGGIVEREENFKTMKDTGTVVYLDTSFAEISHRLINDTGRPLWNNHLEEKLNLFNRRVSIYKKFTDYTVKTDNRSIEEIINEIINIL